MELFSDFFEFGQFSPAGLGGVNTDSPSGSPLFPQDSSSPECNSSDMPNSSLKRRRRLLPEETEFLCRVFEQHPRPTATMRDYLANKLGMSPRCIQIWFQNRRAKVKRDIIESGKAMLLFQATRSGNGSTNWNLPPPLTDPSPMQPTMHIGSYGLGIDYSRLADHSAEYLTPTAPNGLPHDQKVVEMTSLSTSSSNLSFDELPHLSSPTTMSYAELEQILALPPNDISLQQEGMANGYGDDCLELLQQLYDDHEPSGLNNTHLSLAQLEDTLFN